MRRILLVAGQPKLPCATGGIQEIIEDYDPTNSSGYGFLCYENTPDAFWDSIKFSREVFQDRASWVTLIQRAMARDFSWKAAVERYEALYEQIELARAA